MQANSSTRYAFNMDKKKTRAFLKDITQKSMKTQLTERTPFLRANLTRALSAVV